jgi:hypothetical protein
VENAVISNAIANVAQKVAIAVVVAQEAVQEVDRALAHPPAVTVGDIPLIGEEIEGEDIALPPQEENQAVIPEDVAEVAEAHPRRKMALLTTKNK